MDNPAKDWPIRDVPPRDGYSLEDRARGRQPNRLVIHGWPLGPEKLNISFSSKLWNTIIDAVLILAVCLFIVLAIAALSLNGQPVGSKMGDTVYQTMQIGPTFFPIIFAALAGRSLSVIARWHAEGGVRFSTLWALLRSRTVFSALASPFVLRRLTSTSLLLVVLWALSPVGGQASLRPLYVANSTQTAAAPLQPRYMDTGPAAHMYLAESLLLGNDIAFDDPAGVPGAAYYSAFATALMQGPAIRASPRDGWGAVKVPRLEAVDLARADAQGWIALPPADTGDTEAYAALLGLPVVGVPPDAGAVTFTLESAYISLSCTPLGPPTTASSSSTNANTTTTTGGLGLSLSCPGCAPYYDAAATPCDVTRYVERAAAFLGPPVSAAQVAHPDTGLSYACADRATDAWLRTPRAVRLTTSFAAVERQQQVRKLWSADCAATRTEVQTRVRCEQVPGGRSACGAVAVRRVAPEGNATELDYWAVLALKYLSAQDSAASLSLRFLNDSSRPPIAPLRPGSPSSGDDDGAGIDLSALPADVLSARATVLLNTLVHVFLAPAAAGSLTSAEAAAAATDAAALAALLGAPHTPFDGLTQLDPPAGAHGSTFFGSFLADPLLRYRPGAISPRRPPFLAALEAARGGSGVPFVGAATTDALVQTTTTVWRTRYAFVALLLLACAALLAAGLLALGVRNVALEAPDVFDAAVAWTYDNKCLEVASGGDGDGGDVVVYGSVLAAGERARLLRDVRVLLGDGEGEMRRVREEGHGAALGRPPLGKLVLGAEDNVAPLKRGAPYR